MNASHCSLTELLSHQRGEIPVRVGRKVETHLSDGCPVCTADLVFLARLEEVARRDGMATPPPSVLARSRAVFQPILEPAAGWAGRIRTARLIFDSFLEPVPAGMRGAVRLDRHLVFRDDDLYLDVRLDPEYEAAQQSITGQLQSQAMEFEQLSGLPVMLVEGPRVLKNTRTNYLGEFVFEAAPVREMALRVLCRDRMVEIPHLPLPAVE